MSRMPRWIVAAVVFLLFAAGSGAQEVGTGEYRVTLRDASTGAMNEVVATHGGSVRRVLDDVTAIVAVSESRAAVLARDPRVEAVALVSSARVTSLGWTDGMTYTYDAAGNITQIGSGATADAYVYDTADRLVKGKVAGQERVYEYDAFGNRTNCIEVTSGNASCEGMTIASATNRISLAHYDEAGSLTQFGLRTYTYDTVGMLKRDTSPTREYVYGADDERIAIISGSTWNWTLRDLSGKVLRELTSTVSSDGTHSNWQWSRDNVWRNGQILASRQPLGGAAVTWNYHLDHLGTPRLVSDASGTIIGVHDYFAFGAELGGNLKETAESRTKYTGHERDTFGNPAEPLDYMHARYYNSAWGRFLSVDPTSESDDLPAPQSWNRYSYVRNNPLRNIDPDGRLCIPCAAIGALAAVSYESYRQVKSHEPVNNARLFAAVGIGAAAGAGIGAAAPIVWNAVLANPGAVATGTTLAAGALVPGPESPFGAGSFTSAQALEQGLVRGGGRLAGVIGAIEQGAASAKPVSANAAMEVVQQAVASQGLEPGLAVEATGGSVITLQNAGNVTTQIFENGRILVQQGEKVVLDLITKAH
jgi:RHS repeat-associated protein